MTLTLSIEILAQENLLQKHKERATRSIDKYCTDSGFLKTVELGQYFMTKHTDELLQFTEPVTCREYTLPGDVKSTDPKGWIQGNTKIGPVLEVTTCYLQGKYGVDIRIESVNKDNSHSWVRITHGLNKLVTDWMNKEYDDNEQETSTTKTKVFALKTIVLAFASRSKAKAKPRRRTSACSSTKTVPFGERKWIDIEPGAQSDKAHPVAKRLYTLLRHGELPREEDGAIEFWRLKDDLRNHVCAFSTLVWWKVEEYNGRRRRQQEKKSILYWSVRTRNLYLRALQGHSGRDPTDPALQDDEMIPNNFLEYSFHIGCVVKLHSITNSGLIAGGQNSSKDRQTVFFTAVNPMHKNHKDPQELDLTKPRLASYKQKWERHQDTVFCWIDIQFAQRKGLKFYQTRSNAIILYNTFSAHCVSKVIVVKSEEIICQKVHVSPRAPPTISYKDNWMCEKILMLQEAVNTPNESDQNAKPNYQVRGDPYVERKRKSRNVPRLVTTVLIKRNMIMSPNVVDQKRGARNWFQSTRTVKSLYNVSKIILTEQHFMPTRSRITSTTHSAKIRRRWSANWVMWSYSSCAKLYQKFNVLTVLFIGIKELCTALVDNAWLTANSAESLTNYDWMHSLQNRSTKRVPSGLECVEEML